VTEIKNRPEPGTEAKDSSGPAAEAKNKPEPGTETKDSSSPVTEIKNRPEPGIKAKDSSGPVAEAKYRPGMNSAKYDPRSKLVLVMAISSLAVVLNDVILMLGVMAAALLFSLYFKSSLFKVLVKLKKFIGVFAAMIFVQSIFLTGGRELVALGGFTLITTRGLYNGTAILLRMMIIITSATIMGTANSRDIVQGLYQWKIPYELAFMVSVAIRFLPLLKEEAVDIYTALQLRGLDFSRMPLRTKIRIYSYLMMPLISSVLNKARELAIAVEMRGFRAGSTRTSYRQLKLKRKDYLLMAASGLATAAVFYFYFAG